MSYDKLTKLIYRVKIKSSSGFVPLNRISEKDIYEICNLSDVKLGELLEQTGIMFRRYANSNQSTSDLATTCLQDILTDEFKLKLSTLILATTSPDYPSPATSNFVHRNLQLKSNTMCFDIASSCTSFLSGLMSAFGFLNQEHDCVAVCAAEVKNKSLGSDVRMRSLFSDGAAAMILKKCEPHELETGFVLSHVSMRSELAHHIKIPIGGSREPADSNNLSNARLQMVEPRMIFRETVKEMVTAIEKCWDCRKELGFDDEAPGMIFVHQANANILAEVKQRLPKNLADRVPVLMKDLGNTVCASLPLLRVRWKVLECLWKQRGGFCSPINKSNDSKVMSFTCGDGEKIVWNDPFGSPEYWFLNEYSASEQLTFHDCVERFCQQSSGEKRADCWVAAGGGFQTLGLLHIS